MQILSFLHINSYHAFTQPFIICKLCLHTRYALKHSLAQSESYVVCSFESIPYPIHPSYFSEFQMWINLFFVCSKQLLITLRRLNHCTEIEVNKNNFLHQRHIPNMYFFRMKEKSKHPAMILMQNEIWYSVHIFHLHFLKLLLQFSPLLHHFSHIK